MSYYPPPMIRYEYADESNSSASADPPLYLQDPTHNYFLDNSPAMLYSPSLMIQAPDDENSQPPPSNAVQFSPFGMDIHHMQHELSDQQHQSSTGYWQPQREQEPKQVVKTDAAVLQCQQMVAEPNYSVRNGRRVSQTERNMAEYAQFVPQIGTEDEFVGRIHQKTSYAEKESRRVVTNCQGAKRNPFQPMENMPMMSERKTEHMKKELPYMEGPPEDWKMPEGELAALLAQKRHSQASEGDNRVVIVTENSAEGGSTDVFGVDEMDLSFGGAALDDSDRGPPIAPNGFVKPAYSYSCLIGLSLKNSQTGELTVSEIYAFLCYHFPYFREAPSGWKNSVRHNLSLNKCFQKIEVETPGSQGRRSCLWRLNPLKRAKMDSELRKWRDRDEARILAAMEHSENLDALQNGAVGMPPNLKRRRFIVRTEEDEERQHPVARNPQDRKQHQLKTVRKMVAQNTMQSHGGKYATFSSSCPAPFIGQSLNEYPQQQRQLSEQTQQQQYQPSSLRAESVHAQAARKLENLLQQKQQTTPSNAFAASATSFGGFSLIGATNSVTKKRRSSESAGSTNSSGPSSRRQSHHSNEHVQQQQIELHQQCTGDQWIAYQPHTQNEVAPSTSSSVFAQKETEETLLFQRQYQCEENRRKIVATVLYESLNRNVGRSQQPRECEIKAEISSPSLQQMQRSFRPSRNENEGSK